ncbi:MAG: hypothetical protein IIA73_10450 [Proteobacteria bacterium]|nr:hypothetical protein [Pseudomonadota bacterium]
MARCKVSTIPPGAAFVDALAAGLLDRYGGAPGRLAEGVVLLPTRRACLALREAFLRLSGGDALLLPRMMPLGDVDPDDVEPGAGDGLSAVAEEEIPPAIPDLERRLVLTRLIVKRGGAFARADQAVRLAGELARLLDQVQTERLSFDALAGLAPADPNGGALTVLGNVSVGPAGEFQIEGASGNVLTQGSVTASGLGVASDASIGGELDVAGRATAQSLGVGNPGAQLFFAGLGGVGVRTVPALPGNSREKRLVDTELGVISVPPGLPDLATVVGTL